MVSCFLCPYKLDTGFVSYFHPSGDTSEIRVRNWGGYKAISVRTKNKQQVIERSVISGILMHRNSPAFYLSDQNTTLKTNGKVVFDGSVFLPERGLENGYILNEPNELLGSYEQKKSEYSLPPVKVGFNSLDQFKNVVRFSKIQKDTTVDFFSKTHLYTSLNSITIGNQLKGNIVVHSFDSIFVDSDSKLDGVILMAPVVYFEKGFKGSVQVFATKRIHCDENTQFMYPSSLVLNYKENAILPGQIYIGSRSKVLGGISLIHDPNTDFNKLELIIEEKSIVAGLVYNEGNTEIKGKCFGSLYTQNFKLNAGGGTYTNHIRNTEFSRTKLPSKFAVPFWMESDFVNQIEFIKWY